MCGGGGGDGRDRRQVLARGARRPLGGAGPEVVVGEEQRRVAEVLDLAGEFAPFARAGGVRRLDGEAERLPVHVADSTSALGNKYTVLYIFVECNP